jgi:hypothetical protein
MRQSDAAGEGRIGAAGIGDGGAGAERNGKYNSTMKTHGSLPP